MRPRRGGRGGPPGRIRIIGGEWRGRRLPVADLPGLRPTPDRVRETLFNWLQPDLPGARCLDLFAGSGALGLEALSRGAASVTLVESAPEAAAMLSATVAALGAEDRAGVVRAEVLGWLAGAPSPFDVIFLDPPYGRGLATQALERIAVGGWAAPGALVYCEVEADMAPAIPAGWTVHRQGRAGQVRYHLLRARPPDHAPEVPPCRPS